jgi:hypothetical protein
VDLLRSYPKINQSRVMDKPVLLAATAVFTSITMLPSEVYATDDDSSGDRGDRPVLLTRTQLALDSAPELAPGPKGLLLGTKRHGKERTHA